MAKRCKTCSEVFEDGESCPKCTSSLLETVEVLKEITTATETDSQPLND